MTLFCSTYPQLVRDYKEEIRLNTLADLIGMAPVAFSRFFKVRTGEIYPII